jgi:hypothetical protein
MEERMAEFHNPHEGLARLEASEMSAPAGDQSGDLGAGLTSVELPSQLHPAVTKLKELVYRYPISSVIFAFAVGVFLARLF